MDRHWPRGMTRRRAALDEWCPELAPSLSLANQLKEDGDFAGFAEEYAAELALSDAPGDLLEIAGGAAKITILFAASNRERNHAVVLCDFLRHLASQGAIMAGG